MLEFTGLDTVLRALGVLYWALAAGLLALALWKPETRRRKAAWSTLVLAVFGFLPAKLAVEKYRHDAYAKEAWAYFRKKCETEAGEKIYKTFTGVKSVLVVKPLPPATEKDLYDQYWYGDPYSASAGPYRDTLASRFIRDRPNPNGPTKGFQFVELTVSRSHGIGFERLLPSSIDPQRENTKVGIEIPESRFGVSWEDISTAEDRRHWVAGSRLRIVDLYNNTIVAERVGFYIEAGFGSTAGQRRPWESSKGPTTTCPEAHDWADRWFVLRVLRPDGEGRNGEQ